MVKKISLPVSLFIGFILLSACTNDAQPEETPSSSAKPSTVKIKPAYEPNYGDTETIGDLQYTLISLSVEGEVGSGDHVTTGEKQFYSILMTVKNSGTQSVTLEPSFFTLISRPKTYAVAETATLYKNEYEPQGESIYRDKIREHFASGISRGTILTTLEPDEEMNGYIIFDVDPAETFIVEEDGAPIIEKLEIKSNRSDADTIIFYLD
ncbi:DUF4352 domain-containing protein [Desemzia sp. FAM 23989]|uniref:DUF4352 domain-containing protein n=1 Tax=Desemzia sp. FAM 23989 TaxID=3259523 RepID=UPI003885A522